MRMLCSKFDLYGRKNDWQLYFSLKEGENKPDNQIIIFLTTSPFIRSK